jgi:predicted RNase H-like HicB family nuclease
MHYTVQAIIRKGNESGYVAECVDIAVVTQGATLDEVTQNLREAIALYFEGENPGEIGFSNNPPIMINLEMEPLRAQA